MLVCLAAVLWPAAVSQAQLPASAEYSISGVVVNSVTGAPLPRSKVEVHSVGRVPGQDGPLSDAVLSDALGQFSLEHLPAGTWIVAAQRPGYEAAGRRPEEPVRLGPSRGDLRIALTPKVVIEGRVADDEDRPMRGILVELLNTRIQQGRRAISVLLSNVTDDQGYYRFELSGGPFYVRAAGQGGSARAVLGSVPLTSTGQSFAPVYYAGAADLGSAQPITPTPGETFHADLTLHMETGYSIRGMLRGQAPNQPVQIRLLRNENEEDFAAGRTMFSTTSGEFEIRDILPGSYVLRANQIAAQERRSGETHVEVTSSDETGAVVQLESGVDVTWQVHNNAAPDEISPAATPAGRDAAAKQRRPTGPYVRVMLWPVVKSVGTGSMRSNTPVADGRFRIANVLPGEYEMRASTSDGYIASVFAGTADLTHQPRLAVETGAPLLLDVTVNHDGGTISGVVTSGDHPAAQAFIALIPEVATVEEIKVTGTSTGGQFKFAQVAPGSYRCYAWPNTAQVEYTWAEALQQPEFKGVRVDVTANSSQSIELPLSEASSK